MRSSRLAALAALAPPAYLAILIVRYARNMPWRDAWGMVPYMTEAAHGHLRGDLLWVQVNEHRIPVAMLVQGALALLTRWDVRGDAWLNFAASAGSLLAVACVVRRTVASVTGWGATLILATASVLTFSPAAGSTWTAGWNTPPFIAACAACVFAALVAGWRGETVRFVALLACATAGALAFGTGVILLALLPLVSVAVPGSRSRRAAHVVVASVWASALLALYFHGWYPRIGEPRPEFRADLAPSYVRYALAYVGHATGTDDLARAPAWGLATTIVLSGATVWLGIRRPDLRGAVLPWFVLAAYALGNGFITAYGRLGNGMHTALLPRYLPTAGLFVLAALAVLTLAIADLGARPRARPVLGVVVIVLVWAVGVVALREVAAARRGIAGMQATATTLDGARRCLRTCATTADWCLSGIVGREIARPFCSLLERARVGPFRE